MKAALLRAKNATGLALRIIFSVAIVALIIWKFKYLQSLDVREFIDNSHLMKTIGTLLGVYAVKGVALVVPASLIYIVIGMSLPVTQIFGVSVPLIALAVNALGIVVEISVTYLMGIILGGPFVTKKLKATKYGEKMFAMYDKYEKSAVFVMRIAPLPIDFCSLFFGAMRTRYLPFLGMSLAGILPRVILFTILGDKVYGLIPMKWIITIGAAALIVFLIYSTIKYAFRSTKAEQDYGKPAYTPVCELKRRIIFDTEMCTSCDDAGAMAVLFSYLKKYDTELLGICNSTSDPYGNGTIKAICEYYGLDEPLVGQHKGVKIIPGDSPFSKKITHKYCKYESSACAAISETELYKRLLKDADDNSITVIVTGMFTNISSILNEDAALFNKKVHSIVAMAGKYPKGKEFNIETDPISAANVLEKYKGMIVFADYELGKGIKTGFYAEQENNPVYDCYKLCAKGDLPYMSRSFDPCAVQYAFEGNGDYYALSKPMAVTVDMNGNMTAKKDKYANNYFIIRKADEDTIAEYLNHMLSSEPHSKETEVAQ